MKYRIKEVTKNNVSKYYIQRKFLFWWISDNHGWNSYIQASEAIASEIEKVSIKYHEVDINNLGLKVKFVDENGTEIPCPLTVPKSNYNSASEGK
jgi:hypothetical protein